MADSTQVCACGCGRLVLPGRLIYATTACAKRGGMIVGGMRRSKEAERWQQFCKLRNPQQKERNCLRCNRPFMSTDFSNRICKVCHDRGDGSAAYRRVLTTNTTNLDEEERYEL